MWLLAVLHQRRPNIQRVERTEVKWRRRASTINICVFWTFMDLCQLICFPLNTQVHNSSCPNQKHRCFKVKTCDGKVAKKTRTCHLAVTFSSTGAVIRALKKQMQVTSICQTEEEERLLASVRTRKQDAGGISAGRRKKRSPCIRINKTEDRYN